MIQNQALGFYQCREKKQKKQDERKMGNSVDQSK